MYQYTYGMIITINSDNNRYEGIWYKYKKMIYSHIYPSTYDVSMHMLLPKHILVHKRDDNDDMILLPYVSTFYATLIVKGMINISGCE